MLNVFNCGKASHMKKQCHMPVQTAKNNTAKSLQSCPTLCDPMGGSPPGSPISGILQARILEWVAISRLACIVFDQPTARDVVLFPMMK